MVSDRVRVKKKKKKSKSFATDSNLGTLAKRGQALWGQSLAGRRTGVPIQKLRLWAGWACSGLAPEVFANVLGVVGGWGKDRVLVVMVTGEVGEKTGT